MSFVQFRLSAAWACACLLVGACAATPPAATGPGHRPAAATAEKPEAEPALKRALAALSGLQSPMNLDAPSRLRRGADLDGGLLNGLSEADVIAILGPPARIRRDPPAQVWQYDRPTCFVDVFLYDENNAVHAVYVQERDRQVKKTSPGACLAQVWQIRRFGVAP